jgi:predicted GNAT family N-acyltransferase
MTSYETRRFEGKSAFRDAFQVRHDVFVEEQGVPEDVELDGFDEQATHFVIYETDTQRPVATARIRYVDRNTAKAERVAVRSAYRGEGLGRRLMERLEADARDRGCSTVELHAQTAVQAFYETLGYDTVSDEFEEAGIPHVEMEKQLTA